MPFPDYLSDYHLKRQEFVKSHGELTRLVNQVRVAAQVLEMLEAALKKDRQVVAIFPSRADVQHAADNYREAITEAMKEWNRLPPEDQATCPNDQRPESPPSIV